MGTVLGGRYKLGRLLGAGGMGAVYEGLDANGGKVAIKLLLGVTGGREALGRFSREARLLASLKSPNVTRLFDSGIDPVSGAPYLVMELLSGEDAESLLRRVGPLAPELAVRLVLRAAAGVEAAHAAGIIHRDIKPANIFLHAREAHEAREGGIEVKVCDFGIAKQLFTNETMTQSGDSFGSPSYMSPEQARNAKRVDGRTDVWSLGMTLYELLTGATAFDDATGVPEMMIRLTTEDVPSVQARAPWLSPGLVMVVHGLLLRDLDARCPNVGALVDALEPFAGESTDLDASMLVGASRETRDRATRQATLPRSWKEVEASVPSNPPPALQESAAVRLLGHTLGGHTLLRVLGHGGMGAVYETRSPEGVGLAIKVILGQGGTQKRDALTRFVREARAAMSIKSDYVVKVFAADTDVAQLVPYIVMELLEGQDLAAVVRRTGPLEVGPIVRLFVQACQGLAEAHRLGVVHRDIKPANIFVHELPTQEIIAKICDFGVAKSLIASDTEETTTDLTRTGGMVGSPMYFSPEQAKNSKNVDHRTDVWSLAISLYEALSGRRPWEGCSGVGEIIVAVCTQDVPSLQEAAPWVPPELAAVVHKGLQREVADRHASMDAFAAALLPFAANTRLTRTALAAVPELDRLASSPRLAAAASSKTAYATTLSDSRSSEPKETRPRKRSSTIMMLGGVMALIGVGLGLAGRYRNASVAAPSAITAAAERPIAPTEASPSESARPATTAAATASGVTSAAPSASAAPRRPGGGTKPTPASTRRDAPLALPPAAPPPSVPAPASSTLYAPGRGG